MALRRKGVLLGILVFALISFTVVVTLFSSSPAAPRRPSPKLPITSPKRDLLDHHDARAHVQAVQHQQYQHPPPKTTHWNGWEIPENEPWDYFGLKVPVTSVVSRVDSTAAIHADYDFKKVDPLHPPPEYAYGPDPAFKYVPPNDRLFITVSTKPRILYFPNFVTDEEVEYIKSQAAPRLQRSQVAITIDGQRRKESSTQEVRTSKSTWVELKGALQSLEDRMVNITGVSWHEPANVLKYGVNQHYDAHHDYFDPRMYGKQYSNRMASFFLFLEDTKAGGATTFPRANGGPMPMNYKEASCTHGLQAFPKKGGAVLFYDMRPDRSLDPYSLHGGCDVKDGEKWAGVVWFRMKVPEGAGQAHE